MTKSTIQAPVRFSHLHGHSHYSIFDGFGQPKDHIQFAYANGLDGLVFTEHGNMSSMADAYLYSKDAKKGIKDKDKKTGEEKLVFKLPEEFKILFGVEAYFYPDFDEWRSIKQQEIDFKKSGASKTSEEDEDAGTTMASEQPGEVSDDANTVIEDDDETKKSSDELFLRNDSGRYHHLVLLAQNNTGLQNLYKIVSRSYKEGFYKRPRVDFNLLNEYSEGVIASTACMSSLFSHSIISSMKNNRISKENMLDHTFDISKVVDACLNDIDRLVSIFGMERLFLELQWNKLDFQHIQNRVLIECANRSGVSCVSTADFHYPSPELWQARELYKKLKFTTGDFKKGLGVLTPEQIKEKLKVPNSIEELKCELYPKNASQMWEEYLRHKDTYKFYDDEIVKTSIEKTHDIAHGLIENFEPNREVKLASVSVPVEVTEKNQNIKTEFDYLAKLCLDGMKTLGLDQDMTYMKRLKYELRVIHEKNFEKYFLTLRDCMNLIKKHMLVGMARGSGGGSLVNYVLGITGIDPVKTGLLFERFLDPSRSNLPDVDVDVANRTKALKVLKEHYGEDNVLLISNYNTLQLKSLVKDLARFYDIPFEEANEATKLIDSKETKSNITSGYLAKTGEEKVINMGEQISFEDAYDYCIPFQEFCRKYPQVADKIKLLNKQNRSIGAHAGGTIIFPNAPDFAPLISTTSKTDKNKRVYQTPWSEGQRVQHLEPFGWVKFDFLGLETLRIIEECIRNILFEKDPSREPSFEEINQFWNDNLVPGKINEHDENVLKLFEEGRFCGTFQFTEKEVQNFVKKASPKSIDEISAITALFRPGPLGIGADKMFLENKNNPEDIESIHPIYDEITKPTFGLMVFQEQIMQISNQLGKIPLANCYKMIKAISKKDEKTIAANQDAFIAGAIENGVSKEAAEKLFNEIKAFAKYSFNLCLSRSEPIELWDENQNYIGKKPLEDVKIGYYVKSRDEETFDTILVKVLDVYHNGVKDLYKYTTNIGHSIICTEDHKITTNFYGQLKIDECYTRDIDIGDGKHKISIDDKEYFGRHDTIDIEVDHPEHHFYLANGMLVSNSHSYAYSFLSYICGHLFTYYPKEWVSAYMESKQGENPKKKEKCIAEILNAGYKFGRVDINTSKTRWSCDGNVVIPSLVGIKGIGEAAANDLISNRPYTSFKDILEDSESNMRKWKVNKTVLKHLCMLRGYESIPGLVSKDGMFESYKHMFNSIFTKDEKERAKWDRFKTLKKSASRWNRIQELIDEVPESDRIEWTSEEFSDMEQTLMGSFDVAFFVGKEKIDSFSDNGILPINEFNPGMKLYWAYVSHSEVRISQKGKKYLLLNCKDILNLEKRIYVWSIDQAHLPDEEIKKKFNKVVVVGGFRPMDENNLDSFSCFYSDVGIVEKGENHA